MDTTTASAQFIQPPANAAYDTLRRSSSHTPSAGSWVQSPPPAGLQISVDSRSGGHVPLHTRNPDDDEEIGYGYGYSYPKVRPSVHPPPPLPIDLPSSSTTPIPPSLSRKPSTFVGGFVSTLKRFGRRKKVVNKEGTLPPPTYVSNPPTPTVPGSFPTRQPAPGPGPLRRVVTPSVHVTPPDETGRRLSRIYGNLTVDPPFLEDHSTYQPTAIPLPSSPRPTRTTAHTETATIRRPSSHISHHSRIIRLDTPPEQQQQHPPLDDEEDEDEEDEEEETEHVEAHPPQASNYKRMSTTISHSVTTTPHHSISHRRPRPRQRQRQHSDTTYSSDPSFSTELSPVAGFFATLGSMPWISKTGRITVDYRPGIHRGAWGWKRVSKAASNNNNNSQRRRRPSSFVLRPIQKEVASWYTKLSVPASSTVSPRHHRRRQHQTRTRTRTISSTPRRPWAQSPMSRGNIDLLSSGTPSTILSSPSPASPRRHQRRRRLSSSGVPSPPGHHPSHRRRHHPLPMPVPPHAHPHAHVQHPAYPNPVPFVVPQSPVYMPMIAPHAHPYSPTLQGQAHASPTQMMYMPVLFQASPPGTPPGMAGRGTYAHSQHGHSTAPGQ